MSLYRSCSLCVFLLTHFGSVVFGDTLNVSAADLTDTPRQTPLPAAAAAPALFSSLLLEPGVADSISLLSSFPEDLEISEYCVQMLRIFGQRYVAYVNCLVPAARPVKVCQNCFSLYGSLNETYNNISLGQAGPGNESCRDSLLRSDRLMLVYLLFSNLKGLWQKSDCDNCIVPGAQNLTHDTLYFLASLNTTLSCFEKHQQGNHSELCETCKGSYRETNELYGRMEMNHTLCIDLEDAMNGTRKLWSTKFNCSLTREETVAVIAVSSFMLFLPIIFYLSSFLHSEQKKRKLIHPKRAKSYASLMNIQDKQS